MSSFSEKGLLGELEQLMMLGVMQLEGKAHAPSIREAIHDRTGISLSRGTVYVTLERLERKGYLESAFGDPTPERGGKSKRLFRTTATGRKALKEADRAVARMRAALAPGRNR
jgi:PadR family transcriptional regulator, regulatory protein PadR